MLAALNPCGFALLPAYLMLLVTGDQPNRLMAVGRALKMTVAMTAGFTAVFAVFGLLIAPTAASVQRYLPWFTVVIGLAVTGAGLWLLSGRALVGPKWRAGGSRPITRSARSMFGFGVSYAVASLTCTIAPFLAVVASAFRADSLLAGSVLFLFYAAGMGLVVGTAALAVALAQHSLVRGVRRLGRGVPAVGGVLLVLIGAYVAYYGWWETRVLGGAAPTGDPVIAAAANLQRWLANGVSSIGAIGFLLVVAGSVLAGWITSFARRHMKAEPAGTRPQRQPTRTDCDRPTSSRSTREAAADER